MNLPEFSIRRPVTTTLMMVAILLFGILGFRLLPVEKAEPLRLELESFFDTVETRRRPVVSGEDAYQALETALAILDKIEEHSRRVGDSVAAWKS